MRSESLAYKDKNMKSSNSLKIILAVMAFFMIAMYTSQSGSSGSSDGFLRKAGHYTDPHWGGATHAGYFSLETAQVGSNQFKFAAVTDLDQLSRVPDSPASKPMFQSTLLPGTLEYDPKEHTYSISLDPTRTLVSGHNEAGRGMELSELTLYQDRLLTFDDRTGTIFEVLSKDHGKDSYVVPRFVITEGDGDTDKGMKWEWATVKGTDLYVGSMGKEYTNPDGSIANTNNLWIAIVNSHGEVERVDWKDNYDVVRKALKAESPGYVIHEAVLWSSHLKKWVFLPRRVSHEMYEENEDERKGSNLIVLVDENFKHSEVVAIEMKHLDPLHGFSTFAFVPGTKDEHAIAIRSVEEDCVDATPESPCKQRSYIIVFETKTGKVLMDEHRVDLSVKFEGIEFVDVSIPSPYN